MIKGIKFANIPVRNQDQALDFYIKKLGFIVHTDQPFTDKQRWIEIGIPGAPTRMALFTPESHQDRIGTFTGIAFYSDDVQQTYEQLTARGVEFVTRPKTESWGTTSIFKD